MEARGHVFKYGDNVDTDVIIPARYLNSFDPQELASHAMADIDPEFVGKVQPGDMIVARKNFGCGSSREHAPLCLKTAGVSCIIAETFARIFFRNAINIGLPIIECKEAAEEIEAGDEVEIDFNSGKIYDRTKGTEYHCGRRTCQLHESEIKGLAGSWYPADEIKRAAPYSQSVPPFWTMNRMFPRFVGSLQ